MTKELSKQLCELCGLPSEKEVIDPKQKQLADHGDPGFSTPSLIKVTLDFTKPENTLKLIEILSKFMDDEDTGISIRQNIVCLGEPIGLRTDNSERKLDFKQKILKLLLDGFDFGFEKDDELKQSIREAEWVYG